MTGHEDLRVGVQLPTREMAITGDYAIGPLHEFARRAESLGFDSLWTGDSLTARPRMDPVVVLANLASATSRIMLGTAALTAALRHPVVGANMLAALDQVSGGRLTIGVGSGFPAPESAAEFATAGVPFTARVARLDETVAVWRACWRGDSSLTGPLWQLSGLEQLPPPFAKDGPGVWLAASDSPRVLRRVAAGYDGWLPYLPTPEAYAKAWDTIRDLSTGRHIVPGLYATVNIDPVHGRAGLEDYVRSYYGRSLEFMTTLQNYQYGSVTDCAETLMRYVDAGARHIVLRIGSLDAQTQLTAAAEIRHLLLSEHRATRPSPGQ